MESSISKLIRLPGEEVWRRKEEVDTRGGELSPEARQTRTSLGLPLKPGPVPDPQEQLKREQLNMKNEKDEKIHWFIEKGVLEIDRESRVIKDWLRGQPVDMSNFSPPSLDPKMIRRVRGVHLRAVDESIIAEALGKKHVPFVCPVVVGAKPGISYITYAAARLATSPVLLSGWGRFAAKAELVAEALKDVFPTISVERVSEGFKLSLRKSEPPTRNSADQQNPVASASIPASG